MINAALSSTRGAAVNDLEISPPAGWVSQLTLLCFQLFVVASLLHKLINGVRRVAGSWAEISKGKAA